MCSGKVVSTYVTMGFHNFKTWLWKIWGWGVFEENLENMAWRKFPSFTPRIDDTCSKGQKWKCDRCRNICFYKNFWPSNITGLTIFSPRCSTSNGSQTLCQNLESRPWICPPFPPRYFRCLSFIVFILSHRSCWRIVHVCLSNRAWCFKKAAQGK